LPRILQDRQTVGRAADKEGMVQIGRAWLVVLALSASGGWAQTPADVRRDAERGDPAAQYRLGLAYRDSVGEVKDLVEAYKWLTLAAARATADQAQAYAATRTSLISSMTLAQFAEGQKRARAWLDAFEPGRVATAKAQMSGAPPPSLEPPMRIGTDIPAPAQLKHVDPVYPPIAQRARVQGSVILDATISPAGRVTDVRVLRSIPLLDYAAIEAVKQWEFAPTLKNGIAVPVIMAVTLRFELR
jgi:protein TonB